MRVLGRKIKIQFLSLEEFVMIKMIFNQLIVEYMY
jgi:hypothetical protein